MEQNSILTTDVVNNDNAVYGTKGGSNTKDKLFLLNIEEFNKYFSEGDNAVARYKKDLSVAWWWLRVPGAYEACAAYVNNSGNLITGGSTVSFEDGIRPALWVKY